MENMLKHNRNRNLLAKIHYQLEMENWQWRAIKEPECLKSRLNKALRFHCTSDQNVLHENFIDFNLPDNECLCLERQFVMMIDYALDRNNTLLL